MADNDYNDGLRFFLAVLFPAVVAVAFSYFAAVIAGDYGLTLFLLVPVVIGFTSAVILGNQSNRSFGGKLARGFGASILSMLLISAGILVIAFEGVVCLAMAIPLALPLVLIGVAIGVGVASAFDESKVSTLSAILLIASLPFVLGFEKATRSEPTVYKVVSSVEIDAPIKTVWQNVIAFPQIDKEPEGILNLGFAYPINAKIDGTGVGAVRYCNFNTGPFVEPITEWQEPYLLAFDVREQPAPMIETSPWGEIHAAHLDYLRSQKGQFRLYERDGKTIVEGTTYYTHDIAPDVFWKLYSDEIIHQIHMRVLGHIKQVSERQ